MIDYYGREIDYLRISITDRCNLRCVYCMPENGVESIPHTELLNYDEILRICTIVANLGIKNIKITGGEPLVRKDVSVLVENIKKIPGIDEVTLTTNGILLDTVLEDLVHSKIDGINISLDAWDGETYQQITRFDYFQRVQENIMKVLQHPSIKVKLNCVPLLGHEQNLIELARLAKDYPIHVRFIEIMPIGYGKQFDFLSENAIITLLTEEFGELKSYNEVLGNGPSHYFMIEGFKGKIGFISALSHRFCESCNRIRLTSQGFLKTCLQYETGVDIKPLLRDNKADKEIQNIIEKTIFAKPEGHVFLTKSFADEQENQSDMNKIGG